MPQISRTFAITLLIALFAAILYPYAPSDPLLRQEFDDWRSQQGKIYHTFAQYSYRMAVFNLNKITVEAHNARADRGEETYYMGLNHFADLTHQQFKQLHNNFLRRPQVSSQLGITLKCTGAVADSPNPPKSQDWTSKAVEKTVINEGKCAANWAIAAVSAIQGLHALKLSSLVKFSEQQLIDCSGEYGNEGCGGGFMDQGYWYIIDHGLATNKSYPMVEDQQKCKFSPAIRAVNISKCAQVPSQSYDKLLSAVVQQPVSVALASDKFMLYERGIYSGNCGTDIDRGALLVGYGTQSSVDYWIVKNSLGPNWGQKGFIRLKKEAKDGPGMCGIQLMASIPLNIGTI